MTRRASASNPASVNPVRLQTSVVIVRNGTLKDAAVGRGRHWSRATARVRRPDVRVASVAVTQRYARLLLSLAGALARGEKYLYLACERRVQLVVVILDRREGSDVHPTRHFEKIPPGGCLIHRKVIRP